MNDYMSIETMSGICLGAADKITTWKRAKEVIIRWANLGKVIDKPDKYRVCLVHHGRTTSSRKIKFFLVERDLVNGGWKLEEYIHLPHHV